MQNEEHLKSMRHSGAHLLAAAIKTLYPGVKLAVGPAIENGFYHDFDFGDIKISEKDFPKIEKTMERLKKQKIPFEKVEMSIKEGKEFLKSLGQPYTLSLLEDIEEYGSTIKGEQSKSKKKGENEKVTFYKNAEFINMCRGGHLHDFGEVGAFKLTSVAGAYFRGSEKNPMLTRIYAACFDTQEELEEYLKMQEEAKKRDHRILGPQMELFTFSGEVGSGLPLWMPKGEMIKYLLTEYMRDIEIKHGYKYVSTPVIAQKELYERSGHAKYYHDDMYHFTDNEGTEFYIKPMNCPHHHMIYEKLVKSYRDLPLKLAEPGSVYRNELSGTLTGLIRVRGPITMNDSHIYVRPDQLYDEFMKVLELFKEVYDKMGITDYWFRLSLPDFGKDKYGGDKKKWSDASEVIRNVLKEFEKEHGIHFVEAEGEAAFYGPKLDVQTRNVNGKEDTIATSQIDILVPERMDLTYVDKNGEKSYPLIIHRAIIGSYERFIGFFIEKTAGNFPVWLAPVQVQLISLSDEYIKETEEVLEILQDNGIRVEADISEESVGKKIRNASLLKIPAKVVIGKNEVEEYKKTGEWKVKVNWRADIDAPDSMTLQELSEYIHKQEN